MRRFAAWAMIIMGGLTFATVAIVDLVTGSTGRGTYEVQFGRPGESCGDAALYVNNENGDVLACRGEAALSPFTADALEQVASLAGNLGRDGLDDADRDRIVAVAEEIAEKHGDDYRPRGYRSDSPAYFIAIAAGFLLLLVGIARLQAARRHRPESR